MGKTTGRKSTRGIRSVLHIPPCLPHHIRGKQFRVVQWMVTREKSNACMCGCVCVYVWVGKADMMWDGKQEKESWPVCFLGA
ncbi:MAG: hypothetical protein BYD32DRAFT_404050 [Podila humilis]|nr:MAG: hypothetical protein BYD32DRAFT_404050 [Podila humilis]